MGIFYGVGDLQGAVVLPGFRIYLNQCGIFLRNVCYRVGDLQSAVILSSVSICFN
jgi:hypothetical protein